MALGVPIAFALGGLGAILLAAKGFALVMVPQALASSIDNFVLVAVPLFILMANILLKCEIGKDLFAAVQSWVGHWPGGLAVATILSCAIFSAISGSSVATAATIGTVAIPEMIARGYDRRFVYGLLAAGGTLGILIPPSIPMIIYGVITEESVGKLFLAGVAPGLTLAGLFIAYSMAFARFSKRYVPLAKASASERLRLTLVATPSFMLAGAILLGLYLGVFTPTEASAAGFALALVIAALLGRLSWERLREAVLASMATTVTIFLILAGAQLFGRAITLYRIPQEFSTLIATHVSSAGWFVLVVCLLLLVLGLFLESLSMLVVMVPVLFPSLAVLGIDTVWFGIFFVVMMECALITPPVGLNLFVIQAVGKAPLQEVADGAWPFVAIMLALVAILYFVPDLALYLPFKL